jgi:hypothetical protein
MMEVSIDGSGDSQGQTRSRGGGETLANDKAKLSMEKSPEGITAEQNKPKERRQRLELKQVPVCNNSQTRQSGLANQTIRFLWIQDGRGV